MEDLWGVFESFLLAQTHGYLTIKLLVDSQVVAQVLVGSGNINLMGRSLINRIKDLMGES